jgi:hypothetical protein
LADFVVGLAKGMYTGHQQRLSKLIHSPVRIFRGQWPLNGRPLLSSAFEIGLSGTWPGTTDPGWQVNVFRQSATALGVSDNDIVRVGPRIWGRQTIKHVERIYRWRR